MSDNARLSVRIGATPYAVTAQARQHSLHGDEPGELGGRDTGPTPYEFLLAGLGSCKAMTAKMYADRKGWPLTAVHAELTHSRPNGRGEPELIEVTLRFEGDLTDEQRQRLLEIAEKCPVQKTITNALTVASTQA